MTSLGAILVIGKLEGLTREGGEGEGGFNLTFSCSVPKPFFRIMWLSCGFPFPIVAGSSLISPHCVSVSTQALIWKAFVFDTYCLGITPT